MFNKSFLNVNMTNSQKLVDKVHPMQNGLDFRFAKYKLV